MAQGSCLDCMFAWGSSHCWAGQAYADYGGIILGMQSIEHNADLATVAG